MILIINIWFFNLFSWLDIGTYKFKECRTEDKLSTIQNFEEESKVYPKVMKPSINSNFTAFEKSKLDKIQASLNKPGVKFIPSVDTMTPMISSASKFTFMNSPQIRFRETECNEAEMNYFKSGKDSITIFEDHRKDIELLNSAYKTKSK